jgi:acyl carrier protein
LSTTQQSELASAGAADVLAVVRAAVATVLEQDAATIMADSDLRALGIDSLGLVAVAEIVEERLAPEHTIRIPDDDLDRFVTVGDAAEFVRARL